MKIKTGDKFRVIYSGNTTAFKVGDVVSIDDYWKSDFSSQRYEYEISGTYGASVIGGVLGCHDIGVVFVPVDTPIIESNALTGRDLCKAMLDRGDKYVMCKNDVVGEVVVIDSWSAYGFYYSTRKHRLFINIIPINNMGEPLTAKEVGL